MINTPGEDDLDGELDLDFGRVEGGAGPDPDGSDPDSPDDDGDVDADDCMPLDDSKEQVGYELYGWDAISLDDLDDVLHELGLPHEWVSDGFEVVVHQDNEAQVDNLVATLRFPDEIAAEHDTGDDTDMEVISALFIAADRMQRDPTGDAVRAFLDAAEQMGEEPPYGIDEKQWAPIESGVDDLVDALTIAAPTGALVELATSLRMRLHPLV